MTTAIAASSPAPNEGAPTNMPALAEVKAPEPAPLKLQAILFDPANPSAIISGKTLFVGSHIREFHVAAISQQSATLVSAGHTNVLSFEP